MAKSALEVEINKQLRRIKSLIKRAEKRGYTFPSYKPPKVPTRITKKTLEKFKKVTPEVIYKKAKYTLPDSDKTITGTQARKIERSSASKKAAQTRKLLSSVFTTFDAGEKELAKSRRLAEKEEYHKRKATEQGVREEKPDAVDSDIGDYAEKLQEQKRINELIERWKIELPQRGYLLPKGYLDELKNKVNTNLHSMSLDDLKEINEEALLSSKIVKFKDPMTGTIFTGTEGQEKEKLRAKMKEKHELSYDTPAKETERTLELVQEYIDTWSPSELWTDWFSDTKEKDKNTLKAMLEGAIRDEGADVVARRMQENAVVIWELVESILYESGGKESDGRSQIQFDMARFSSIITGKALTQDEAMELAELMESYEVY